MVCPKCGSNIKEGDDYCVRCGTIISTTDGGEINYNEILDVNNNTQVNNITSPDNNQSNSEGVIDDNITNNVSINEDEDLRQNLVESYVGYKYIDFANVGFSWTYFLFGDLYLLYRKMYGYFFKVIILRGLIITAIWLLPNVLNKYGVNITENVFNISEIVAIIIYHIIIASNVKNNYLNHADKKVQKISREYTSLDASGLSKVCEKKGGTNLLIVIIVIILEILAVISMYSLLIDLFNKYMKIG